MPSRSRIVLGLFVLLVVLQAIAPFRLADAPRAFGWIPFRSFLETPMSRVVPVFFEKSFLYGTLLWLGVDAGFSLPNAAAIGGSLVLALRLAQVWIPGRSAEITDCVLLLLLAVLMRATDPVAIHAPLAHNAPAHRPDVS